MKRNEAQASSAMNPAARSRFPALRDLLREQQTLHRQMGSTRVPQNPTRVPQEQRSERPHPPPRAAAGASAPPHKVHQESVASPIIGWIGSPQSSTPEPTRVRGDSRAPAGNDRTAVSLPNAAAMNAAFELPTIHGQAPPRPHHLVPLQNGHAIPPNALYIPTTSASDAAASEFTDAEIASMERRGVLEFVRSVISRARIDQTSDLAALVHAVGDDAVPLPTSMSAVSPASSTSDSRGFLRRPSAAQPRVVTDTDSVQSLSRGNSQQASPNSRSGRIGSGIFGSMLSNLDGGAKAHLLETRSRPFVSDLTFRCARISDSGSGIEYTPWSGDAAVMFIDLTGYSKITAALASRGAYVISQAVNSTLAKVLEIAVGIYHGDVVKFAGDAMMLVWELNGDLVRNVSVAITCALHLQRECGYHPIDGTDGLAFRMHIGVVCGPIETTVLHPPAKHTQPAFHFLSGEPFAKIGNVVDAAQAGEVCISSSCVKVCRHGDITVTSEPTEVSNDVLLCTAIDAEEISPEYFEFQDDLTVDRSGAVQVQFVPPPILDRLQTHSDLSAMAEMRFLCVLFIDKASPMHIGDWYEEVHEVLDTMHCPTVQLLDDDKGTHLIAAVGLYKAEREASAVGVDVVRTLIEREIECHIGMASGPVFCGAIGSERACRWDITGPACVRAARLMQHATANSIKAVVDGSVFDTVTNKSALQRLGTEGIPLKGSPEPVPIFTLSTTANPSTGRIISASGPCKHVHVQAFRRLRNELVIKDDYQRAIAVVEGPVGSGKAVLCVRSVDGTNFVPLVHNCVADAPPFHVGTTIAQWFNYLPQTKQLVTSLHEAIERRHTTKAFNAGVALVDAVIKLGIETALVIRHAHLLDSLSAAFLRQVNSHVSKGAAGRWLSLLTVFPLYGARTSQMIVKHLTNRDASKTSTTVMSNTSGKVLHVKQVEPFLIKIDDLPREQAHALVQHRLGWRCARPLEALIVRKSGGLPSFIDATIAMIQRQRPYITQLSSDGMVHVSAESEQRIEMMPWPIVSPGKSTSLLQLLDALPTRETFVLKVIAALTRLSVGAPKPIVIDVCQQLLKSTPVEVIQATLPLLIQLRLINDYELFDVDMVEFANPALRDVVETTLIPDQVIGIANLASQVLPLHMDGDSAEGHLYRCRYFMWAHRYAERDQCISKAAIVLRQSPDPGVEEMLYNETVNFGVDSVALGLRPGLGIQRPIVTDLIPMMVVQVKNYIPPMALGPQQAPLLHLAEAVKRNFVKCAENPDLSYSFNGPVTPGLASPSNIGPPLSPTSGSQTAPSSPQSLPKEGDNYHRHAKHYAAMLEKLVEWGLLELGREAMDAEIDLVERFAAGTDTEAAAAQLTADYLDFTKTTLSKRAAALKNVVWSQMTQTDLIARPTDATPAWLKAVAPHFEAILAAPNQTELVGIDDASLTQSQVGSGVIGNVREENLNGNRVVAEALLALHYLCPSDFILDESTDHQSPVVAMASSGSVGSNRFTQLPVQRVTDLATAFPASLMTLAVMNWVPEPRHSKLHLEAVRDAILVHQTEDFESYAVMLALFASLGDMASDGYFRRIPAVPHFPNFDD